MLTDAFVPMLTYPEQASVEALPGLTRLLDSFATHVTYCGVEIEVPDIADRWGTSLIALPQLTAELESRSRHCAADLLHRASLLESKLEADRLTIRAAFADPGPAVARQARHHDFSALVVRGGSADHQALAESLIFGSGRPLLIVPETGNYASEISLVAIAWDGTPTSYAAIFDAMPIISKAMEIVVLTASDEKLVSKELTGAMLAYLDRHGPSADVREVVSSKAGIGNDLQHSALSIGADLLVMGAYGHSRFREFILGGATADVLNGPSLATFLSR